MYELKNYTRKQSLISPATMIFIIVLLVSGSAAIVIRAFYYEPNRIFIILCFCVPIVFLSSLVFIIKQHQKDGYFSAIPLALTIVIFSILWFVPWGSIEFQRNIGQYNQVIELLEQGKIIPPYSSSMVLLPEEYRQLSAEHDGEIFVVHVDEAWEILFFDDCGLKDACTGRIFRSDDNLPQISCNSVEKIQDHWFYCLEK